MIFLSGPSNQSVLPIIAVRDGIVFPKTENVLTFGRSKSISTINEALKKDKRVVLVMQKNSAVEDPKKDDLYEVGVIASIEKTVIGEKGEINALVKGIEKVKIVEIVNEVPFFEGKVEKIEETLVSDNEVQAMVKHISLQVKKAINLGKAVDFVFLMNILNVGTPQDFSYHIAMVLDIKEKEKQNLLEENDLKKRLVKEVEYINKEVKILEIEQNISAKTQRKFEKGMKETFLKEKMKTIEEELGGGEDRDIKEYRDKIVAASMPKAVEEKALKELKRLSQMSQYNPEASYVKTYLDWLVDLPWSTVSTNSIDIKQAEKILNEDHFGLKKIKERILEYLAVIELRKRKEEKEKDKKGEKKNKEYQPTIICFVGPPGVGKTSLGRSIARALGRKFVKMSLGGIRDEAEIRGHRRTYVGALPGRIIQGVKQAGTRNPLFMLDEIDKIGRDYRGDASAALLEALDPEQNHAFSDHYLEVPFDLSDVFFITTANMLDTIPEALLDRLEIINFPGYTEDEKFHIVKDHLIKKQIDAHSLTSEEIKINDAAVKTIIRRYTREAGVRELERQVAGVFRKIAREIVEKKTKEKTVTTTDIPKYLGPYKYSNQIIEGKNTIGISTGLAWTQAGGDILFIEVAIMPGKGSLTLTGHLGDVMKESCQAALSYIRSRWEKFNLKKDFFHSYDIHVHVPEGAVPKDGPSAGLAIATAMLSALTKTPFKRDVAMTGEITLRGRALEIGGVKEKVIAAHRAGIKTVIIPKDNKKDLEDIPAYVLNGLKFVFVEHMDDVLNVALVHPPVAKNKDK
ncbi:endopeptidase La [Candidatus Roizmanbacteria bacterium RIFOXYB2_FULL_38_10]|uniref:Lon protease n=1 Tax=Candidatus Roizmanbacteria bacterium RIFOXYD1_FULL_38_12 TaxID=1802093 RepID=A0A1F7L043_9BACT|nr:MAG: endopeptidase La [Candidatus Roizmanbacteria bacterium RIFOXYA2_FULL_38_14]OGK63494.1 MAG: endopeptidase La [Candidatus Roizmanbacteria bacterium RIFOXYA1_FULL_37_12]OGK65340.1 MAG: endopeptidase La [Candidatus Roizmanbacteria bacterium RIFOXYB1_FULL_40_23]OGK67946.1 MAG: endopeptidase La [Candidatus Roizmanbacteria bacterium RIFOXYB2_FULL_38_10]OGK69745.1 MAG: endopeptidase La [Candidatus Roizmanbacteria bacterium RIFOXYC1_FULL_38_14]OGK72888.1 MAG: endopeptidase La [Candidatus Roizma